MRKVIVVLAVLTAACVQDIKQDRVEVALVNAGLSQPLSECMAKRMAEKLTIAQLHHLQALGVEKRTYGDYIKAVKSVHDNDALEVLLASFALCKTGIVR